MASGGSATPWPKPTVITVDWPQRASPGTIGWPASGSSIGTREKNPMLRSQSCWRLAPTSSAMCAAAGLDEYAITSGIDSHGAKWSVFMSEMV